MHNFLNTSKYSCRKAIIRIPMSVCQHFLACFVVILIISCPTIDHVTNFEFSCFGFTFERGVLYLVSNIYHWKIFMKNIKNVLKNYIWIFFSNVKGDLIKYLVIKVCYCIHNHCNKTFKHYKKRIHQPQHIDEH